MNDMVFSWAEDANGKMVHVDSVPNGLKCNYTCPHCHERLMARHGEVRAHCFAHHSMERGANLDICYMVIMYKLAEQIIQQEKRVHIPSYYGIFRDKDIVFSQVAVDDRYDRIDKQPDVIGITPDGEKYLIEFTFAYKVQHKEKIDYRNLNCIEIDLSAQTFETLRDFLLHSSEGKKWLNNQSCFEQIEELYSSHGKLVKVTNESDCYTCELKKNCCGIRWKGEERPIIIENSGGLFRVCKVEEFNRAKNQLEESQRRESERERLREKEREIFLERRKEIAQMEIEETAKIRPEERTCFMCSSNLVWKNRSDGYANCGSHAIMRVPPKTPPTAAKTCRGFRLKPNNK